MRVPFQAETEALSAESSGAFLYVVRVCASEILSTCVLEQLFKHVVGVKKRPMCHTSAWRGRSKRKPKKRYIEQRGERDGGGKESRSIESRLRLSSTCLTLSIFRRNRSFS